MMHGNYIVAEARKMLGVPFVHQGRNPAAGVDCAGLIWCVADALQLPLGDVTGYAEGAAGVNVEEILAADLSTIEVDEMAPGDVVTFRTRSRATHMGFASDVGLIHAWGVAGRVIEHALTKGWRKKISKVYRWRR
ncbi:MAG: hypothetical protein GY856_36695 [bacterium]|nr:hypothetical protein [bacterium]